MESHPGINRRGALGILGLGAAAIVGARHGGASAQPPASPSPETKPAAPGAPLSTTSPMLKRAIPGSGEELPVVGMGTWQTFDIGDDQTERSAREEVLREFSALGGSLVDSSPMYRRAEQVVGDLATTLSLRPKLFVATKVWTTGKEAGIKQMEESLKKLRADPIDLMQVHNLVDVATHLETLREWKKAGRVRYIGVTHYTASSHAEVAKVISNEAVDFVQINYSVGEREAEERLLPLCRERKIAVIANRPLVGGNMIKRLAAKPLPDWAAELGCESWAQLLLKFVIAHPAITCVIPATSKVKHLRENMQAGVGRMPSEDQRRKIAEAAQA